MLYLAGVDQAWNKGCAQTTLESLFLHVMKHNEDVNMVGMAKLKCSILKSSGDIPTKIVVAQTLSTRLNKRLRMRG